MEMGLTHDQFLLVQAGTKTIEIRLNDQKCQQLEVGDQIVFEGSRHSATSYQESHSA